jgi:hypothetical protein
MDDAAVVAGLVGGQLPFRFQYHQGMDAGPDQGHGRGQADNAAADDGHIIYAVIHW